MNTKKNFFEKVFDPKSGFTVFVLALLLVYGLAPIFAYFYISQIDALLSVSTIIVVTVVSMVIGRLCPILDSRFRAGALRLTIPINLFIKSAWCVFGVFLIVTFATAPSIPLLSAFAGLSADDISQERGEFLKGRQGAGIALLYISAFLTNTIIPYSIVAMYSVNSKWRNIAAAVFFLFCISFMQKALFLNLILPMLVFFAAKGRLKKRKIFFLIGGSLLLISITTFLSLQGDSPISDSLAGGEYLSAQYQPVNSFDYLVWRSTAVPLFTAVDTLVVHKEQFGGELLLGTTSTFVAALLGAERINLERFVFQYQFGGWNETANANAVFAIDAYVNFGWFGVIVFGSLVGLVFRCFRISSDISFQSLWVVFAFVLFNATLIGMLLSNGFLYMLVHALFFRLKINEKK
jgi:hypothetical protein